MNSRSITKLFLLLISTATTCTFLGMYDLKSRIHDSNSNPQSPTFGLGFEQRLNRLQKRLDVSPDDRSKKETRALIRKIEIAQDFAQFREILNQLATKEGVDLWQTKSQSWGTKERNDFIMKFAGNQPVTKQLLLSLIIENATQTLCYFNNQELFSILEGLYGMTGTSKS